MNTNRSGCVKLGQDSTPWLSRASTRVRECKRDDLESDRSHIHRFYYTDAMAQSEHVLTMRQGEASESTSRQKEPDSSARSHARTLAGKNHTHRLHGLDGELGHVADGQEERHEDGGLHERHQEDAPLRAVVRLHKRLHEVSALREYSRVSTRESSIACE